MRNVKLDFRREADVQSRSEDLIVTAEVRAENEQSAEIFLDNYLEEEYPDYGRKNCHFEENGIYYFNVVKKMADNKPTLKNKDMKNLQIKKENWNFIPEAFVPVNEETKKFLEENKCRKFSNPQFFVEEMYWHQQNPCPERLKVVHIGRVEGPYFVALVGTKAFNKSNRGISKWGYWQKLKIGREVINPYLNLEEREDGLYAI